MSLSSSVRIRLQRWGERHRPFYRIVACNRKAPRDGKFLELLGTYNPIPDSFGNKQVSLQVERLKYWIRNGAEPSERVAKILGIAEVLPPAPRRFLPEQPLLDDEFIANVAEEVTDNAGDMEHIEIGKSAEAAADSDAAAETAKT